ncbi:hypothetical protein FHG87_010303 [Trinorchestia longiramus]|nr:hypothetical protein FHG87_010303 [Trinorchestia longiramus]
MVEIPTYRVRASDQSTVEGIAIRERRRSTEKKVTSTVEHLVLECSKYEQERESLMDVVHEQCGENNWNARCVEEDSGMRYLVGLDEECNMTVVDAMKDFLLHAWNKREGC